jgi:hypothetical protein
MKTLSEVADALQNVRSKPEFYSQVANDLREGRVNLLSISRIEGEGRLLLEGAKAVRAILRAEQTALTGT